MTTPLGHDFTIGAHLDIDASAGDLPYVIRDWVEHMTSHLAAEERARMAPWPASVKAVLEAYRDGDPYGEIKVKRLVNGKVRNGSRILSDAGLTWFAGQVRDALVEVHAQIGWLSLGVEPFEASPGWLQLSAYTRVSRFDRAAQEQWAGAFAAFADRVNPGYGQIGYHQWRGGTAVEQAVDRWAPDRARRGPEHTIGRCRETLRGYDWVTVVPAELVGRLGGAGGLAASGAFAEVRPLARGGVLLRTTAGFRDHTAITAEPAFRALAPVLPPGRPHLIDRGPTFPPLAIVDEDPAAL
ncbi:hypothetical protein [Paractinoplanes atraurantiacus]|uniref:DUF3396 domain-containing protein n=1 Tax=Paractinoplanes atraurantiacus TaxID=1036182 RepID=A0A285GZ41_9ACTN|nr:hypothetical protein [Actinoplanes atraurantiacus]SNY28584.1 hypothetical protein SAMN05421748_103104 [Actinoplanes atraurantiacus]